MSNPYINPFGEGYEEATELGPEVELLNCFREWVKPNPLNGRLFDCQTYRQPLRLRVGEHYLNRDGVEVAIVDSDRSGTWEYRDSEGHGYKRNGEVLNNYNRNLITHLPREYWGKTKAEKMEPKENTMDNTITVKNATLTLDEAIALGKEAQRIKAENEIKAGDYFLFNGFQINKSKSPDIDYWTKYELSNCKKITNPAYIQALKEIYEGMK